MVPLQTRRHLLLTLRQQTSLPLLPPPPHFDYGLSDYSDLEHEFHFSPVTTTSSTNRFAAFTKEEETKQKWHDKNNQIITEAHAKLDKMKVAFSDSDEDVDDEVEIIPPTTLIDDDNDDDNDDDDDDDGDNLDKKPPARLTVMEQMDLLEEQCKSMRWWWKERTVTLQQVMWAWQKLKKPHAASTLMASRSGTNSEQTSEEETWHEPHLHTSTKRLDGQFNSYPSTCLNNLKCVYQHLHPHFGLHNSIFCRGGCQNSYDTLPAIQWKQKYYGPKAVEDLHLWQIQNLHPSHGPVNSYNSWETDQDLNPSLRNWPHFCLLLLWPRQKPCHLLHIVRQRHPKQDLWAPNFPSYSKTKSYAEWHLGSSSDQFWPRQGNISTRHGQFPHGHQIGLL